MDSIENVVISAGACVVTILPELGGKIASIRIGNEELLQQPLNPYALRNATMAFSESDASGWDECLPSVAECQVETEEGLAKIPDHGDLWRVPWRVLSDSPDAVTMRASSVALPLEVTRSMIVTQSESGWWLRILYTVMNTSEAEIPWAWAAHPLFTCAEGDRIELPSSVKDVRVEGSRGDRLGKNGGVIAWPETSKLSATLNVVPGMDAGTGDKLFAGPVTEGWCVLERPSVGLRLKVVFDAKLTPYLGLWLCYGGWPEGDGLKQVCVAMEPTTGPVDSLAETGVWSRSLKPGERFDWPMELRMERIDWNGERKA